MYNRTYIRQTGGGFSLKEIRFIHTADLHLDSPFLGLSHLPKDIFNRIQESTFIAFEKIIDAALERNVDFIVIVGDLFDGEDRSIKAQARLRRQLERLKAAEIAVFISHGNHDHLAGNWVKLEMPNHVYTFKDEVETISYTTKNGCLVHLYGFSYPERHVSDRRIENYHKVIGGDFHIGLLHGHCEGGSSLHQPYAPFSIPQLLQKAMDYWALGHIHQTQILHTDPYIIYPGNIQGRNRKEEGIKGCYEVRISLDGTTSLDFIETADIRWELCNIKVQNNISLSDLYTLCLQEMESKLKKNGQSVLLDIVVENPDDLQQEVRQKIGNGEFIEMLQEDARLENEFIWPFRIRLQSQRTASTKMYNESFLKTLDETGHLLQQPKAFEGALSSLFSHMYGSRYIHTIEEAEKDELLEAAKNLVIDRLGS